MCLLLLAVVLVENPAVEPVVLAECWLSKAVFYQQELTQ